MQIKPLTGIKVIDLTNYLPGPMCTRHLADMGAEVIKIEEREKGDFSRSVPPLKKINSAFFLAVNRNKYSIALDLKQEEGKNILFKLSENANVLVESFRPGVAKKLGIDYNVIKSKNPKIIYCSITGYGQVGPYSEKAGHDLNFSSYAGIVKKDSITNFQIADIVGGTLTATMGILAALIQQKTTGEGQYLDVSILDGTLAHSAVALAFEANENDTSNLNSLTGDQPCYNIYETKDKRLIALAAIEFKFWKSFCEAIDKKDLIQYHMTFDDNAKKIYNELSLIFKTKTLSEWLDYFKDKDCCVSPVLTIKEALNNEHVKARDLIINEKHPIEGDVTQFSLPIKFSSFNFNIEKPAPMLGEDTEKILKGLGYSEKDIEELKEKKII